MNCDRIEEFIPRYLENDLSEEDRGTVEAHLASCARCRESLEAFTTLEESLGRLKVAVPSWETAEARLVRSFGFEKRRSFTALVFNAPFFVGLSFVLFGVVFFLRGNTALFALQSLGRHFAFPFGGLERTLTRWFEAFAGLDLTILISIYGMLTIALLGASRLLVLKFGRK